MSAPSDQAGSGSVPLRTAALAVGAFAQLAQILIFRELLAVCHGTELLFGVILAAHLSWTALGVFLAGSWGDIGFLARNFHHEQGGSPEGSAGLQPASDADAGQADKMSALRRRAGENTRLATLISWSGPLLVLAIVLVRMLAGWGRHGAGQTIPFHTAILLAILATAPAAVSSGGAFGLALRMVPPRGFARLYSAESWGAVLAGLGFTLVLAQVLSPVRSALAAGWLVTAAAVCSLTPLLKIQPQAGRGSDRAAASSGKTEPGAARREPRPTSESVFKQALSLLPGRAGFGLVVGAVVSLLMFFSPVEEWSQRRCWNGLLPGYDLLATRETPYGRLAACRQPASSQVSLFHNGALVASLEPRGSASEGRTFADLCACLHARPRRALLIGGALDWFPTELWRHDLQQVEAVELDPALFSLARRYRQEGAADGDATSSSKLPVQATTGVCQLVTADARAFIRRAQPATYDLIIVSLSEPDTATVNRFCTIEFFEQCGRCLTGDGVFALSMPAYGGGADYLGEALGERTGSVWRALRSVFPEVRAAPIHGFLFVAACRPRGACLDPSELGRRLASRPGTVAALESGTGRFADTATIPPEAYFEGLFGGALAIRKDLAGRPQQPQVEALEARLSATAGPLNRDAQPVVVRQSLWLDAELRGGAGLARLLLVHAPWLMALPLLVVGAGALWVVIQSRWMRSSAPTPVGRRLCALATGWFGMALPVALLMAYQSVHGCIYSDIGILSACFMAGLALGAGLSVGSSHAARRRALAGLTAMSGLALVLPAWTGWVSGWSAGLANVAGFWIAMSAAGFLDGAVLPALVLSGAVTEDTNWTTRLYAFELMGAGLGALLCGAVWVPYFGLAGATLGLAGIVAMPLLALWQARGLP
jgi:spermidine synthase